MQSFIFDPSNPFCPSQTWLLLNLLDHIRFPKYLLIRATVYIRCLPYVMHNKCHIFKVNIGIRNYSSGIFNGLVDVAGGCLLQKSLMNDDYDLFVPAQKLPPTSRLVFYYCGCTVPYHNGQTLFQVQGTG